MNKSVMDFTPSARVNFVAALLVQLRRVYEIGRGDALRDARVEQINQALDYLHDIDVQLADHRAMCRRMREAAELRKLPIGEETLDRVLIQAIDDARAGRQVSA